MKIRFFRLAHGHVLFHPLHNQHLNGMPMTARRRFYSFFVHYSSIAPSQIDLDQTWFMAPFPCATGFYPAAAANGTSAHRDRCSHVVQTDLSGTHHGPRSSARPVSRPSSPRGAARCRLTRSSPFVQIRAFDQKRLSRRAWCTAAIAASVPVTDARRVPMRPGAIRASIAREQ